MTDFALHKLMTRAELAGIIDSAGPSGSLSPRTLLGAPKQPRKAATGALSEAARVLRDPGTRITLRIWGGEAASAETTVFFPTDPASGGGYLLNDLSGDFNVSGPVEAEQILALVVPLLPPTIEDIPFIAQFDPTSMVVLAAIIDIARDDVRQHRIARVLDGRRLPDVVLADLQPIAPARLAAYLEAWWAMSRFDQLLTYAVALGGRPLPPDQAAVAAALLRLSEARLLMIDSALHIAPAPGLAPQIEAALGLCAGFQWQRIRKLDDGALSIVERIVLPCAGGRILDLSVTAAGLVRLARVSRDEITAFLIGELSGTGEHSPLQDGVAGGDLQKGLATTALADQSPQTTARLVSQARRFCQQCGHPVDAADRFCGECGTLLS